MVFSTFTLETLTVLFVRYNFLYALILTSINLARG